MIFDSDCNDTPEKTKQFDLCASDFAVALAKHDSTLYRINLPKLGNNKVGLDDYLIEKLQLNDEEIDSLIGRDSDSIQTDKMVKNWRIF